MNFHSPIFKTNGRRVDLHASVDHDKGTNQVTLGQVYFAPDFGLLFEPNPDASIPHKAHVAVRGWLTEYRNELLDLIAAGYDPSNRGDTVALAAIKALRDTAPPSIPAEVLADLLDEPAPPTSEELAALRRLIAIAQRDTGQSARCAAFLLAWWNAGSCGGFDFTELWAVDTAIARDMLAVAGLIARHRYYPDHYINRATFDALVRQWRPQLFADEAQD